MSYDRTMNIDALTMREVSENSSNTNYVKCLNEVLLDIKRAAESGNLEVRTKGGGFGMLYTQLPKHQQDVLQEIRSRGFNCEYIKELGCLKITWGL